MVTPLDLFKYPSLRSTSLIIIVIFTLLDFVLNFHGAVIGQIGVNPEFNSLMIGLGEVCVRDFLAMGLKVLIALATQRGREMS